MAAEVVSNPAVLLSGSFIPLLNTLGDFLNSTTYRRQPLVAFRGSASLRPQWRQVAVAAAISGDKLTSSSACRCHSDATAGGESVSVQQPALASVHIPAGLDLSAGSSSLILLGFGPYWLIPAVFLSEILTCTCECGINMYTQTALSMRARRAAERRPTALQQQQQLFHLSVYITLIITLRFSQLTCNSWVWPEH